MSVRVHLAVSVGGSKCAFALVDAATRAIGARSRRIEWTGERIATADAFVAMIATHAQRLLEEAGVSADAVDRVGVAWPGPETDRGFQATFIPGCETPQPIGALLAAALAARLGSRFLDVPVRVRLDAIARAAGEARPGGALSGSALPGGGGGLLVNIATGIAGAIVFDGRALLRYRDIGRNYGQFGRFLFWNVTTRTWSWRSTTDGSIPSESSHDVRWTRHGAGPALARRLAACAREAGVVVADPLVAAALRHYEDASASRHATHEIALLRWATASAHERPDGPLARFVDTVAFEIGTALNTLCDVFAAASIARVVLAGGIGEHFGADRDAADDRLLAGVRRALDRRVTVERSRVGVDAELVGATSDLFTGTHGGPMDFETSLHRLRSDAPSGVVITDTADDVPSLPDDFRTPLRRCGSDVRFVVIAQPTRDGRDAIVSIPDALGINGETQVGEKRAKRIMQSGHTDAAPEPLSPESCTLCPEMSGTGPGAFAVDNGRPFGPFVHKVVCSSNHIETLGDLRLADVVATTELLRDIAAEARAAKGSGCDGVTIGMNFGVYAKSGATQRHFHYQVAGLGRANYNAADRLGRLCRAYRLQHAGADYLSDYERALRQSNLVVFDHELAFAYKPISPRFKDEIQIMLRRPGAGHMLDLSPAERQALSELQCQVFERFDLLKYRALNQVWYATRFSADNDYGQRLAIGCYPRSSIIAFYELAGNHVIDSLPWQL